MSDYAPYITDKMVAQDREDLANELENERGWVTALLDSVERQKKDLAAERERVAAAQEGYRLEHKRAEYWRAQEEAERERVAELLKINEAMNEQWQATIRDVAAERERVATLEDRVAADHAVLEAEREKVARLRQHIKNAFNRSWSCDDPAIAALRDELIAALRETGGADE